MSPGRTADSAPAAERRDDAEESTLTISEVARAMDRSPQHAYHLIVTQRLTGARKQSGRWLVPAYAVRAYVKAMRGVHHE